MGAGVRRRTRWTVTTHVTGQRREIEVFIYERLAHLRAAATRHSRQWDDEAQTFPDTLGVCQTYRRVRIKPGGEEVEHAQIATIRLHRRNATLALVAHESMHAAAWLYRVDCTEPDDLAADHLQADNEILAECLADVFDAVWRAVAEDAAQGVASLQ